MNCQDCKYSKECMGSHHLTCNHPITEIPELKRLYLLKAVGGLVSTRPSNIILTDKETQEEIPFIEINLHGAKNGWCIWPFDFDPIWISNCLGFEQK